MTDTEKIERLAKWMGWHKSKGSEWFWAEPEVVRGALSFPDRYVHDSSWNPLTNIADAWMLVEKIMKHDSHALWDGLAGQTAQNDLGWFFYKSASAAARAISETVLKVIEELKGGEE